MVPVSAAAECIRIQFDQLATLDMYTNRGQCQAFPASPVVVPASAAGLGIRDEDIQAQSVVRDRLADDAAGRVQVRPVATADVPAMVFAVPVVVVSAVVSAVAAAVEVASAVVLAVALAETSAVVSAETSAVAADSAVVLAVAGMSAEASAEASAVEFVRPEYHTLRLSDILPGGHNRVRLVPAIRYSPSPNHRKYHQR